MKVTVEMSHTDLIAFAKQNLLALRQWGALSSDTEITFAPAASGMPGDPYQKDLICPFEAFERWVYLVSGARGMVSRVVLTKKIKELTGLDIKTSMRLVRGIEDILKAKTANWRQELESMLTSEGAMFLLNRLR